MGLEITNQESETRSRTIVPYLLVADCMMQHGHEPISIFTTLLYIYIHILDGNDTFTHFGIPACSLIFLCSVLYFFSILMK